MRCRFSFAFQYIRAPSKGLIARLAAAKISQTWFGRRLSSHVDVERRSTRPAAAVSRRVSGATDSGGPYSYPLRQNAADSVDASDQRDDRDQLPGTRRRPHRRPMRRYGVYLDSACNHYIDICLAEHVQFQYGSAHKPDLHEHV